MNNSEKLLNDWIADINKSIASQEKDRDFNDLVLKSIGNEDDHMDIGTSLEVTMTVDFSSSGAGDNHEH